MYTLLYKLHFSVTGTKKQHVTTLKIIKRLSNYILPFYFYLTGNLKSNRLNPNKNNIGLIVSLTTFPARINKVWLTIETILRQHEKPDKILLWLYRGEFNGRKSLPKCLLRMEKRGLEIRFCDENLMPHKKYYYTMKEFPNASVITIDDDMFYPLNLIAKLLKSNKVFPKAIICPITRKIASDGKNIKPYKYWAKMHSNEGASVQIHTMGGGGTLFPPDSLHPDVFDLNKLKELALKADDLWLKVMSLKQGTKVVSIAGEYPRYFLTVRIKNNVRLMDTNIHEGQNDFIFRNLLKHYDVKHLLISEKKQVLNEK